MPLAVLSEQFPSDVQVSVLTNTGESIKDLTAVGFCVLHTVRRYQRQSIIIRNIDKFAIDAVLSAKEMPLNFHEHLVATESVDEELRAVCRILGSARVSRVGFGVAPKQSFKRFPTRCQFRTSRKVRDGEDALASARDACATQKRHQTFRKLRQLFPSHCALSFLTLQMCLGKYIIVISVNCWVIDVKGM